MFTNCYDHEYINIDTTKFVTSQVTNMESMFSSCRALDTFNLSNFDTRNVTDMTQMFNGCSELQTLT